jgi:hypothetical protein
MGWVTYYAAAKRSGVRSGPGTFGDDLLRGGQNTSGTGEEVQMLNMTQGVRNKKSIAQPRCISAPIRTTILESLPCV